MGTQLRLQSGECVTVTAVERRLSHEAMYNLEVAGTHTYFIGEAGILVHNGDDSAFRSRDGRSIRIYVVWDDTGRVIYAGQTGHADVQDRLLEHINDPSSALYVKRRKGAANLTVGDPRNRFRIEQVAESRTVWTPYEAAVWEQHFIDEHGGVANLRNRQNAITPEKFDYRNLHNPC